MSIDTKAEGSDLLPATLDEACRREILELHAFFQDWFNGEALPGPTGLQRLEQVLAEDFEIISPEGRILARDDLLRLLARRHGSWRDAAGPTGSLRIESPRLRFSRGGMLLATYEEWMDVRGDLHGRLSTACFEQSREAPNGLLWLHVHETWLPDLAAETTIS